MATLTSVDTFVRCDEDISDIQIAALLKEAEERLRRNAVLQTTINKPSAPNRQSAAGKLSSKDALPIRKNLAPEPKLRRVDDPVVVKQDKLKAKKATAGPAWYNMPRTDLTPELQRDLQLLKMRNVLDPHRHYKKDNARPTAPEFSQIGTIIEGPTDFYSARLQKHERFETFTDEVLANEKGSGRFKNKYGQIQEKKTSGKKGHYKKLMAKRAHNFKR